MRLAESSVGGGDVDVVAEQSSAARNAGTVTALAREAPCGSAQAMRTNCSLSLSILRLISAALASLLIRPQAVSFDEPGRFHQHFSVSVGPKAILPHTFRHARPWAGHPRLSSWHHSKLDVDGREEPGHDDAT